MRGEIVAVLVLALLAGCNPSRAEPVHQMASSDPARPWGKPGDKIDSILPMPEYFRRFRVGLVEPRQFAGGEPGREALARRFLQAVSSQDTAEFGRLLVSQAEFAWLFFPHHRYAGPPYELDPAIFWLQLRNESAKGLHRVLARYGGTPLRFLGMSCGVDSLQMVGGPARVWSPCRIRYRTDDSLLSRRLFGSIVVRDGRAKLLSYANDF